MRPRIHRFLRMLKMQGLYSYSKLTTLRETCVVFSTDYYRLGRPVSHQRVLTGRTVLICFMVMPLPFSIQLLDPYFKVKWFVFQCYTPQGISPLFTLVSNFSKVSTTQNKRAGFSSSGIFLQIAQATHEYDTVNDNWFFCATQVYA